ncbi:MAG: cyclopropane fatty acyl phospholipid synthase [Desulfobacteraceae bacterium]|jgi:cyclopropane-fatty-acyl-phospholipid synthase|nr:cyclopropane fatty acyl phospholipid synthase [Desulfobacteraceae bacterium]
MRLFEKMLLPIFDTAGVSIDGKAPWDIEVHHSGFYRRVMLEGSLGLGESYMDGWWDCAALDQFFERIIRAGLHNRNERVWPSKLLSFSNALRNMQQRHRARKVVQHHYDPHSDIIVAFLDPYNQYSCGYFKETDDLNQAQKMKLDLICRKLQLSSNDRVLDIGCGWGGFARYAAENYRCRVTGISTSGEQLDYARQHCQGLPVQFHQCDYRQLKGTFDKILVCGMIEHVGYKNYRTIMQKVGECLSDEGLFLLQTIGGSTSVVSNDPWIEKYFFPNSMLPSLPQITEAAEDLFVTEDLHSFGHYYDNTLMAWYQNFQARWPEIKSRGSQRDFRMWSYYFLHLAGTFRARKTQLWQFVFSKKGIPGGLPVFR